MRIRDRGCTARVHISAHGSPSEWRTRNLFGEDADPRRNLTTIKSCLIISVPQLWRIHYISTVTRDIDVKSMNAWLVYSTVTGADSDRCRSWR